ncbi:uncharacterized protein LOC122703636 [Cervus elaphus]|uniref:uncharacterized protein LOC122703636 n=1 Tax=Cervus elaphus TaxID=9860 RepID=UPI001CC2725C|nr:uncharacterized protein LOC122703636 [Cervus elaphus]XP_043773960.1 uncharacterized protein LOC122703636 [Cervus elaphus]XP_043773961.1 uncharacterized protein LOC122703636 [Cervus elaphus]
MRHVNGTTCCVAFLQCPRGSRWCSMCQTLLPLYGGTLWGRFTAPGALLLRLDLARNVDGEDHPGWQLSRARDRPHEVSSAAKTSCSPHPPPNPIGSPGASLGTGGCAAPVVQLPDAISRLRPGNVWARRVERAPQGRRREEPRWPAQRRAPPPWTSSGISRAGLLCVPSCVAGTGLALPGAAAGLRPHSWCPQVTRNKSRVGTCEPACAVWGGGVRVMRVQEAWARPRRGRPCFSIAPALPHHSGEGGGDQPPAVPPSPHLPAQQWQEPCALSPAPWLCCRPSGCPGLSPLTWSDPASPVADMGPQRVLRPQGPCLPGGGCSP